MLNERLNTCLDKLDSLIADAQSCQQSTTNKFGFSYIEKINNVVFNDFTEKQVSFSFTDCAFEAYELNVYANLQLSYGGLPYCWVTPIDGRGLAGTVDGYISISETYKHKDKFITREYSNVAMPMLHCFSNAVSGRSRPNALCFDKGWYFSKGSSLRIAFTPIFTQAASQIVFVLTGTKHLSVRQ